MYYRNIHATVTREPTQWYIDYKYTASLLNLTGCKIDYVNVLRVVTNSMLALVKLKIHGLRFGKFGNSNTYCVKVNLTSWIMKT